MAFDPNAREEAHDDIDVEEGGRELQETNGVHSRWARCSGGGFQRGGERSRSTGSSAGSAGM